MVKLWWTAETMLKANRLRRMGSKKIVLEKSKKDNSVLFIDASALFTRVENKNKLMPAHQKRIFEALTSRQDEPHFTRLVSAAEIEENNYNISVSSYVEKEDTTEVVDITVLNSKIPDIVARQSELRTQVDAIAGDLEESTV